VRTPSRPVLEVTPLEHRRGFALRGTLDLSTDAEARKALEPAAVPGATLTLDLSGLAFMDSTGLNLIAGVLRTIGDRGHLTLRVHDGIIERVLGVAGIEDRPNVTILPA
jgi:anti-anti-sigma factor